MDSVFFNNFEKIFKNKKVLITGHTGFTGGWICSWLKLLGANITGFSLPPTTSPNLYDALKLKTKINFLYFTQKLLNTLKMIIPFGSKSL